LIAPIAPAELGRRRNELFAYGLNRFRRRSDPDAVAILIDHTETAVMRNSNAILCKAMVLSLLSALLASSPAQARPAVYSKTLTFTLSTTTPAPPAARPRYYFPGNTKYSNVRAQRAGVYLPVAGRKMASLP